MEKNLPTPNHFIKLQAVTCISLLRQKRLCLVVLSFISTLVTGYAQNTHSLNQNSAFSVYRTAGERPKLAVQLLGDLGGNVLKPLDGLVTVFDESFKASIGMEDSYKLANDNENIAINRGGTSLSIEGRPIITSNDTLPIRAWKFRNKNYALKLEPVNFPAQLKAFVKDAYLNQEIPVNLQTGGTVPFTVSTDSSSFAPNRFMIVLKSATTLPVTIASIAAYQKNKGIQVDWIAQSENNVAHYEIERSENGQQFNKTSIVPAKGNNAGMQSYNWYDAVPKEGNNFYRLKVIDKEGTFKYTSIVRVNLGSKADGLSIYSNPITNNTLGLQFSDMKKGNYTLSLYNNSGQKVFTNVIGHSGVPSSYSIGINAGINAGIYRLSISNGETNLVKSVVFR